MRVTKWTRVGVAWLVFAAVIGFPSAARAALPCIDPIDPNNPPTHPNPGYATICIDEGAGTGSVTATLFVAGDVVASLTVNLNSSSVEVIADVEDASVRASAGKWTDPDRGEVLTICFFVDVGPGDPIEECRTRDLP